MINEIQIQIDYEAMKRQRNFFAGNLSLAIAAIFLLCIKLSNITEKIIMVPGINQEMTVDNEGVSKSYLEETSLLFISALLDLTPDTVDTKKDIILKHTSKRSSESIKALQKYFSDASQEHKKFQLSTFFSPKKLFIDSKKMQVVAEGILTKTFGKKGFEESNTKYKLSFEYVAGRLFLKEFLEIKCQCPVKRDHLFASKRDQVV